MENIAQAPIQTTLGQALNIAKQITGDAIAKQQEFLSSHLMCVAEEGGRSALAARLMVMADSNFKFDWKEIYATLKEDELDDDSDSYVKFSQAWRDGTFPLHLMDDALLDDSESREALTAYVKRVGNTDVKFVQYELKANPLGDRFLNYRQGVGISVSASRRHSGRAAEAPRGHIALGGCETLAELYARGNCVTRWARRMVDILRKATKKRRFSVGVQEQVDTLIKVLNVVRKIDTTDGEGYELRLLNNEGARQLTLAFDSLDACAVSEIREALIRYEVSYPPSDYDSGSGRRKIKKHIKDNGALLSADLLGYVIKNTDDEEGACCCIWESIAMLDIVGVARSYVRKAHLIDEGVDLESNWLELNTAD